MRVIHYSPTAGSPCGIGQFSINLNDRLMQAGCNPVLTNSLSLGPRDGDILLYQHEFSFEKDPAYWSAIASYPTDHKIAFIHSDCTGLQKSHNLFRHASLHVTMVPWMISSKVPVLVEPCPGYIDGNTDQIPEHIVGTFSMISGHRNLLHITKAIIEDSDLKVMIGGGIHASNRREATNIINDVKSLAPNRITVVTGFIQQKHRWDLMRKCKALWCWSDVNGPLYASASCVDMAATGVPLIVRNVPQHNRVICGGLQNVTAVDAIHEIPIAVKRACVERKATQPPLHIGWNQAFTRLTAKIMEMVHVN